MASLVCHRDGVRGAMEDRDPTSPFAASQNLGTTLSPGENPMRVAGLLLLFLAVHIRPAVAQSVRFQAGIQAAASLRLPSQNPAAELRPTTNSAVLDPSRFRSRAPGATLMIIGGAAIVAGILVGGNGSTILILGGVGVGAYGLYLYTR